MDLVSYDNIQRYLSNLSKLEKLLETQPTLQILLKAFDKFYTYKKRFITQYGPDLNYFEFISCKKEKIYSTYTTKYSYASYVTKRSNIIIRIKFLKIKSIINSCDKNIEKNIAKIYHDYKIKIYTFEEYTFNFSKFGNKYNVFEIY